MKFLQLLLSVCATFIGVVYVLKEMGVTVEMELSLYYYLLLVIGLFSLFVMPYSFQPKRKGLIEKEGFIVEKELVHQLLKEALEGKENISLEKTFVKEKNGKFDVTIDMKVVRADVLNADDQTKELVTLFTKKTTAFFGEKLHFDYHIVYVAGTE